MRIMDGEGIMTTVEPHPVIPVPTESSALKAQRVYLIVLGAIVIACIAAILIISLQPPEMSGTRPEIVSIIGAIGSVCVGALAALARG